MNFDFITLDKALNTFYALCFLLFGYLLAKHFSSLVERTLNKHISRHHVMLLSRTSFYMIFAVFFITSLQYLGFKLSVLLGAAGVVTVALSFASQTAASNLISGIFLIFERPFRVGDTIEIKGINGVIDSIDLLSTKLKTPDNKLVRIPNEALIKSEITNLSYFATRRLDLLLGVAYDCDITKVKHILLGIANNCESVLKDPAPNVIIDNFANSVVELKFMVWVHTAELSATRNTLQERIKQLFDREGIESPLSQVAVHRV